MMMIALMNKYISPIFALLNFFPYFSGKKLNIFKHKMNICVPLKLLRWQDIASNFFTLSGEGHAPIHP
jgi:hypothetical protein